MNADCLIWKWFFFTSLKRQRMCSTQLSSKLKQCPGKCQHKLTQVEKKNRKLLTTQSIRSYIVFLFRDYLFFIARFTQKLMCGHHALEQFPQFAN